MACTFARVSACVKGDMGQRLRNDFVPSFKLPVDSHVVLSGRTVKSRSEGARS